VCVIYVHAVIDEQEILSQIQNDSRSIDRLASRAYCRDYDRLGLGSLNSSQSRSRSEGFKLVMVNSYYTVCQRHVNEIFCLGCLVSQLINHVSELTIINCYYYNNNNNILLYFIYPCMWLTTAVTSVMFYIVSVHRQCFVYIISLNQPNIYSGRSCFG